MSLKYLDEVGLAENIAQEKLYIEGIRAALDAAKQDVIQVTNLGSATADKVGIAYQYMGTTTGSYKHGWFYEAVEVTPATDPATYTWQEFEFGGGLPYATTAPSNPEDGDVFVYIGATNLTYKKGGTYQYSIGTQFYAWGSGYDFTLSETPSVNDVIYNSTGEATPNYVVAYDSVNDAIEDNNGDTMARNSAKDKVIGKGWTLISPYNAGVGLEVDTITNTLSTKIATNHSLGVVKGGSGTNIEANGEITVVNRLLERYEGAGAYIDYSNPIFLYTGETTADFTHGGIYEVTLTEVEPVGTEDPSDEGWYEYYNGSTYAPTHDVTVNPQKTYYEATYTLLSSSGFTFNTDDFDVVDSEISLDATQRTFTGTAAEWEDVVDKSIYTIVNLTDDEPAKAIPLYADMAVGTIVPFGGSSSVDGFLLCDGSEYNRTDYPELFEVIGTSFGTPSANTKFKVPDLREATTKGAGLTGLSNNHLDANGLALGEFINDRFQSHAHQTYVNGDPNYPFKVTNGTQGSSSGWSGGSQHNLIAMGVTSSSMRDGATTEVKAVGVNYLIKAKQIALPIDLQQQVVEANEYSTTETIVGKWIDGKPIYRKVFYNDNWTDDFSYDANALNIDEVTSLKAMWNRAGNWFEAPYAGAGGFYSTLYYNTSSKKINFEANVSHAGATNRTIIEYTKED